MFFYSIIFLPWAFQKKILYTHDYHIQFLHEKDCISLPLLWHRSHSQHTLVILYNNWRHSSRSNRPHTAVHVQDWQVILWLTYSLWHSQMINIHSMEIFKKFIPTKPFVIYYRIYKRAFYAIWSGSSQGLIVDIGTTNSCTFYSKYFVAEVW